MMRTTVAFNGSFFNTNRMVKQYTRNAYYPLEAGEPFACRKKPTPTERLGCLAGWGVLTPSLHSLTGTGFLGKLVGCDLLDSVG